MKRLILLSVLALTAACADVASTPDAKPTATASCALTSASFIVNVGANARTFSVAGQATKNYQLRGEHGAESESGTLTVVGNTFDLSVQDVQTSVAWAAAGTIDPVTGAFTVLASSLDAPVT